MTSSGDGWCASPRSGTPTRGRCVAAFSVTLGSVASGPRPVRALNGCSPQDAGVSDGVAAGLGPDAQAVRAAADLHAVQEPPRMGAERVDLAVVAAAEPEDAAVGADAAHVG